MLLEQLAAFFSDGIGAAIARVAEAIYYFLYPANAEAAHVD